MKIRSAIILSCFIGAFFLSLGYEYSQAQPKQEAPFKVGIVNIRKVFRECKINAQYRQETVAEYNKVMSELEKLSKELEADEAGLKTLKPGSPDYLKQYKQVLDKRAVLDTSQEYHKQNRALKERQFTEELYKRALQVVKELSEQKGLNLVFERGEPEFPAASSDELVLTISTHKLLYSGDSIDITSEVIARLDAENK